MRHPHVNLVFLTPPVLSLLARGGGLFKIVNLDESDSGNAICACHHGGVCSRWKMENGGGFQIARGRDLVLLEEERIGIFRPIIVRAQERTVLVVNPKARIR